MRLTLRGRLLLAYLVPTTLALGAVAFFSQRLAEQALDASLGARLESMAQAAAVGLRPDDLAFVAPGEENSRTYTRLRRGLAELRDATGLRRVVVFDPRGEVLVDSDGAYPIGAPLPDLARDRVELERVLAGRPAASSVLFTGSDGLRYKSGYAPVLDASGAVVAGVLVDGASRYFETLMRFRSSLLGLSLLGLLTVVLVSIFFSRNLSVPIRRLAAAARRIGEGDLDTAVPAAHRGDEVGLLARGLEEMRADLRDRDWHLQMMLAGIAHEVRNPLGGLELFSGLLAEEVGDRPEQLAHVRRIQKELRHLGGLVEAFLDYARARPLEPAALDAGALTREVAELVAGEAQARGVEVRVEADASADGLRADPGALRGALLNLLRNAVQASPERSVVRLAVYGDRDWVRFTVDDAGPGVPAELRERVFEPFFTTRAQGSGLGLALARKAADAHGGRLGVADGPRGGARFELALPRRS